MSGNERTSSTVLPTTRAEIAADTLREMRHPDRGHERWYGVVVPAAVLIMWEVTARAGWLTRLLFPAPSLVIRTLVELTENGVLPMHVGASLQRIAFGFLAGVLPGVALGLAMGWLRPVRLLFDPIVSAFYAMPRLALFPLVMIFFGIGETSKIVIIALGVFFPALINAMAGVRNIHQMHFEVARSYGASPWRVFTRVVLPGSLPTLLTGLRLALALSLLLVIGVEFISARTGIGAFLWMAWETFRTVHVYVGLVVSAFLGVGMSALFRYAERRLLPWAEGFLHK